MARAGSNSLSLSLSLLPLAGAGQDRMPRCAARFLRASSCRVALHCVYSDALCTIKTPHFPRAAVKREQFSNREREWQLSRASPHLTHQSIHPGTPARHQEKYPSALP